MAGTEYRKWSYMIDVMPYAWDYVKFKKRVKYGEHCSREKQIILIIFLQHVN